MSDFSHYPWHYVKIKHHTQPWEKTDIWSIRLAQSKCFTYCLLLLEDCHHEEDSFSYLSLLPFRDYNKLGSLPWTVNHIKLCYILESPWSHMGRDQTLQSYCQRRKKVCLHSITNLMISFWSLWSISSQSCDYQKVPASTLKSHHLVSLPIENSIIL